MSQNNAMLSPAGRITKPETSQRWIIMLLCMGAVAINYIDRVNLSVAAPTLMKEFGLNTTQMGVLMSAFFWSYFAMMMPSGAILNRIGAKAVIGWGCVAWGLSTMATALVSGFNSFLAVRVLLGVTEAPVFPGCARVVSVWIPKQERTTATAMFDSAARMGSAFTPPLVVWLLLAYGWQMSFVITGGIAVVYGIFWFMAYHEPDDHPKISKSELAYIRQDEVVDDSGKVEKVRLIGMFEMFTYPKALLIFAGFFCYSYFWGVFTTWIPSYLVVAKGLDLKAMGSAAMYPYIAGVVCELAMGPMFDMWLRKGASLNLVRKTGMAICLMGCSIFMYLAVSASTPTWTIIHLTIAMGLFSGGACNTWSIPNDIAPYGQGGGVAGCMNTVGQTSSLLAPLVTGYLIGTSWGYDGALYLVVGVSALGWLFYSLVDYSRLVPRPR